MQIEREREIRDASGLVRAPSGQRGTSPTNRQQAHVSTATSWPSLPRLYHSHFYCRCRHLFCPSASLFSSSSSSPSSATATPSFLVWKMFGTWFSGFRRRRRALVKGSLEPVLLVSGMGGSILNARNKNNGGESRVWVRIILANLEFKRKLWSLYNSKTGYTKSLDPNIEIVVPEDDHGLYAIDILDPAWWVKFVHLTDVYHFHYLIDMLVKCGYEKGTTLFGYGYDFRQSNRTEEVIDGLKVKLETAYVASGGKKINIISHSMGGLLVLCFISLHRDIFEKYVNKWICIACPFQGAPGCINDSLLTGLQFVYGFESFLFVSRWAMHQLLVECPSVYEMLPNPDFGWKHDPLIQVWRKQSNSQGTSVGKLETFGPLESVYLFEEALRDNELAYDGKSVPLPFNFSIFKWSAKTRKILTNAQLPDSVSFYNIFGTSFDTPFNVCYGSESSPLDDYSKICHSMPIYSFVDGDGTVPAESAMADGLAAIARVGIQASHRGLLNNEKVFECIKQWLGVGQITQLRKPKYARNPKVADVFLV